MKKQRKLRKMDPMEKAMESVVKNVMEQQATSDQAFAELEAKRMKLEEKMIEM